MRTEYRVSVQANSVAGLGACPAAGAVGLVTSAASDGGVTYSLYHCAAIGGAWVPIGCDNAAAGTVAYVPSDPGTLFVCADLAWTAVPLPAGPQGPQGDAGPQGPQGNSVTVTPEPPGANCPAGGQKIQVVDASGNPVGSPEYVCNGGQCRPGQPPFCNAQVANSCSASGTWVNTDCAAQAKTCVSGVCQGVCAQGAPANCNGQTANTSCNASGQWNTTDCTAQSQTCISGSCQGQCAPGQAPSCNGQTASWSCNSSGQWINTIDCAAQRQTCISGSCQGVCAQGEGDTCWGETAYSICNSSGQWINATDCAAQGQSCIGGSCQGVCTEGTTRSCDSGIQGCAGTQTCTGYGTWEPLCHATNCQPFPLAASQNYDCSDACFGASCDDYPSVQCPYGTVPTGECDANCISGCCVGQTSGTGCDWGASLVGAKDACWLHMGTAACNGMTMSVTAWCVGQPN